MYENDQLNTFSIDETTYIRMEDQNALPKDSVRIRTRKLDEIIAEYCGFECPDFMDIDIEGYDFETIKNSNMINTMTGPKIIMCEVRPKELDEFNALLLGKGYYLFCRVWTNNIYIRKDFISLIHKSNKE